MALLRDPLPAPTARLLRLAVLELARSEHRRRFRAVLHVGAPGGPQVRVEHDESWDRGVRADVVAAALQQATQQTVQPADPWVWLTRPGHLSLHDTDAAWLAPSLAGALERGGDPTFVVVTRHGWLDPRSGATRTWRRIRQRTEPGG